MCETGCSMGDLGVGRCIAMGLEAVEVSGLAFDLPCARSVISSVLFDYTTHCRLSRDRPQSSVTACSLFSLDAAAGFSSCPTTQNIVDIGARIVVEISGTQEGIRKVLVRAPQKCKSSNRHDESVYFRNISL